MMSQLFVAQYRYYQALAPISRHFRCDIQQTSLRERILAVVTTHVTGVACLNFIHTRSSTDDDALRVATASVALSASA